MPLLERPKKRNPELQAKKQAWTIQTLKREEEMMAKTGQAYQPALPGM